MQLPAIKHHDRAFQSTIVRNSHSRNCERNSRVLTAYASLCRQNDTMDNAKVSPTNKRLFLSFTDAALSKIHPSVLNPSSFPTTFSQRTAEHVGSYRTLYRTNCSDRLRGSAIRMKAFLKIVCTYVAAPTEANGCTPSKEHSS